MKKLTNTQRRLMSHKAMALFRAHLFKRNKRLDSSITVEIKFVKLDDAWGVCDNHDVGIKPKEFTIYINRDLKLEKDVITTVAHEMVHVWQYATGKFRDYAGPAHRYEDYIYDANMAYRDMPWEIEARKFEKILYKLWAKNNT